MFVIASPPDGRERAVGIFMATARAIPQLADGVKNPWAVNLLVRPRLVITRVTAGAIRPIGRIPPRYCLAIAGMTGQAAQIGPVVARVVSGCVSEIDGCPLVRVVAAIALQRGDEMVARFPGCTDAVVTRGTASSDAAVIEVRWYPGGRRMADVALSRGRDVGAGLAGRRAAVVAG